jgi:hypothetical protein
MKSTTSATQSDVQRYRSWLKSSAPIVEIEQRFLDEPDDLLAFCAHNPCPTCGRHGPEAIRGIVTVLVILTLPSTLFFFLSYPRLGVPLLLFMAVALYPNRDDATRAVVNYLRS